MKGWCWRMWSTWSTARCTTPRCSGFSPGSENFKPLKYFQADKAAKLAEKQKAAHAKLVKTDEPVVLCADIEAEVPPPPTRWTTTLSSKVNWPHTIDFRASCVANVVTLPRISGATKSS